MLRFTFIIFVIVSTLFLNLESALSSDSIGLNNNDNIQKPNPSEPDAEIDSASPVKPLVRNLNHNTKAFDKSISILVSSSLTNAMQDLIQDYSVRSNISVNVVFDSPSELVSSIESGESADVYISEVSDFTDLQQKGLIDGFNIYNLYSDTLVVVAAKGHPLLAKIAGVSDPKTVLEIIASNDLPVIVDPGSDPAGYYSKEVLQKYGLWDDLSRKVYRAANTRSALYLISKGNRTGIVYKSDAIADDNVVILAEIPENMHEPIMYKGAVIAGENMQEARKFLSYLQSDDANKIFINSGLKE